MSAADRDSNERETPQGKLDSESPSRLSSTDPKAELGHPPIAEFTRKTDFGFLPIPPHLRYHANKQPRFGIILQLTFVFATTFTVSNLYYCQPLLITLSRTFNVSYTEVARIPTLTQAGYATGLLLITPIGDLVRRRSLLLLLVLLSASLSIGLALTNSIIVFEALSFLIGTVTVTPQVLIPLTADLAPPHRRASAISITFAGLLFGILLARVLSGTISNFSNWRNVYYMAIGLQYTILILLYSVLPDCPAKDPDVGYFGILKSMAWFAVSEPILIQACLVACAMSATFVSYWVTLTFLLGGPPYFLSDLKIGLFGLVGMLGVATSPIVGRFVDQLVPWNASILATFVMICFQAIQAGAGGINIGAVIVSCFGLDVGTQMMQVSLSTAIFAISHAARARLNAVFIFAIFLGQIMGSAIGSKVFVEHGWRATAVLSLAWMGFQGVILMLRGPHCPRKTWFGWQGGWSLRPRREKNQETIQESSNEKGGDHGVDESRYPEDNKV